VTVPAISTSVKSVAGGQRISLKSLQLREPLRDADNLNVGVPSSDVEQSSLSASRYSTSTKGHESVFRPRVHSNNNNSNLRLSQEMWTSVESCALDDAPSSHASRIRGATSTSTSVSTTFRQQLGHRSAVVPRTSER
jgi:hypothetical protein